MAREKTIMELQDILKRLKAGHTIKQINRETGTHRGVIRKLKNIALQNDWFKKDEPLPILFLRLFSLLKIIILTTIIPPFQGVDVFATNKSRK